MIRGQKILAWVIDTFGVAATHPTERGIRFLEEALELAQRLDVEKNDAIKVLYRVYSRPPGDLGKEIGQAGMTLEALAANVGFDLNTEIQREFDRVLAAPKKELTDSHAAKVKLGISRA